MKVFFLWAGVIFAITLFSLLIINKNKSGGSKFRVKLTALFVLFVFIPAILFVIFSANLITKSMDMLLVPGLDDVLSRSLDTVRKQAEQRGVDFLLNTGLSQWNLPIMEKYGIYGAAYFVKEKEVWVRKSTVFQKENSLPDSVIFPQNGSTGITDSSKIYSRLFMHKQTPFIQVVLIRGNEFKEVYYRVPEYVLKTRDKLTKTIEIQSTLSFFKKSILEKNVIWSLAVLVFGLLIFLSFYAARKIADQISRPVNALVTGMEKVKDGDLSYSVKINTKDEFRFLSDSFNSMIKDLKLSREKLKEAERVAAWQQVARAISHEIKNSLTPVMLSIKRIKNYFDDKNMPENVKESFYAVEDELRSLSGISAEFSDFARLPKPDKNDLDINEIVSSVVMFMQPVADKIELSGSYDAQLPRIYADRDQIKRVLINLIKNSIEACRPGDKIVVKTDVSDKAPFSVKLTIKDTGTGMDQETVKRVFEPDFTTKKKGTGLGLVIVRKIISDHEGKIEVRSKTGEGTVFTVYL